MTVKSQLNTFMQQYVSNIVCWSPYSTPPLRTLSSYQEPECEQLEATLQPVQLSQAGNVSGWPAWMEISLTKNRPLK